MRNLIILWCLCAPVVLLAQEKTSLYMTKTVAVKDSIRLDSVSINPYGFWALSPQGDTLSLMKYHVDYAKALLFPGDSLIASTDSIQVRYRHYPKYMTQKYYQFDLSRVVSNQYDKSGLYTLGKSRRSDQYKPFDGLNTTGSISRGITAGTNQSAVLDSKLDLQIMGKINDKVSVRASIQDAGIPLQQYGYSKNLNQFDRVFVELYGKHWRVRGGDVDLVQERSYFGNFHKKVQGLSVAATLNPEGHPTRVYAAGALVRGVFTRNEFQGMEGNQGPYKLTGPNGELFALVVSGSETVYVNGIRLKRGENADYTINYNAGEIRFNPTFPITSNMRIVVEFQYADRNYSRVVAMGGAEHQGENWEIGGFVYSESDLRNQPLQQSLSDEQKQVLAAAGDDSQQMIAPSAVPADFSENKVLYKKDTLNGQEIFVYSNNPDEQLYAVKFSLVGAHRGNYVLADETAIMDIYEYVPPINGIPQGKYAPVTRLFAPTKLQIGVINGGYHPSEKTDVDFELAVSSYDQNTFSTHDDADNEGFAGHVKARQELINFSDSAKIEAFAKLDFVQNNFKSIEPLYNVEFERDWNLIDRLGDEILLNAGINYTHLETGFAHYQIQKLDFSENFRGTRHVLNSQLQFGDLSTDLSASYLKSDGLYYDSEFSRLYARGVYSFSPFWTGINFNYEFNKQWADSTRQLTPLSQKFRSYGAFVGIGDSTSVYAEIGYMHRVSDSLRGPGLQRVNVSDNYYIKSQLVNSEQAHLFVYINYRNLKNTDQDRGNEQSLNSRIVYHQSLFNRVINLNTVYETSSGNLPRQEFTYVEVEPGKGRYTWRDYNQNGVQELNEFEVSPYPDQAKYVRVLLPNRIFIKTSRNKFSQILTLNFAQLDNGETAPSWWSHFYNQLSYLIDRKVKRGEHNFSLNPFQSGGAELEVHQNFRNSLYFNRGQQHFTTSYTFISAKNKNLFAFGLQENILKSHQLDFTHKLEEHWLFNLNNQLNYTESASENFQNRAYRIKGWLTNPKISYLLSPNTRFEVHYQYNRQQNQMGEKEQLKQQKLGISFSFSNRQKYAVRGEFNYIYNDFTGNSFSPVAYEMLAGLQPEKNYTWQVFFQKKITDYLDLNLAYRGRKSEGAPAVHTGSVQLKAYF